MKQVDHILIIDDDPLFLLLIKKQLANTNFQKQFLLLKTGLRL